AELLGTVDQEAGRKQCFTGSGAAANQGGRPLGRPPLVISSRPGMPVGALASARDGAPMLGECCIVGSIAQQFADLNATLASHGRVAVGVARQRVKTTRQGVFFNACVINFTNSAASCESSERAAQASPRPSSGFGRGMMWKCTWRTAWCAPAPLFSMTLY